MWWSHESVYPRVCGGTLGGTSPALTTRGLSPRVRGNRCFFATAASCSGSIPACAGEPMPYPAAENPKGVYPRVCGGTQRTDDKYRPRFGLSPRVRGNPLGPVLFPAHVGSIPACAGEPTGIDAARVDSKVYPRVCGGTVLLDLPVDCLRGLSPRVRGNRLSGRRFRPRRGSIPACAGEPPQSMA